MQSAFVRLALALFLALVLQGRGNDLDVVNKTDFEQQAVASYRDFASKAKFADVFDKKMEDWIHYCYNFMRATTNEARKQCNDEYDQCKICPKATASSDCTGNSTDGKSYGNPFFEVGKEFEGYFKKRGLDDKGDYQKGDEYWTGFTFDPDGIQFMIWNRERSFDPFFRLNIKNTDEDSHVSTHVVKEEGQLDSIEQVYEQSKQLQAKVRGDQSREFILSNDIEAFQGTVAAYKSIKFPGSKDLNIPTLAFLGVSRSGFEEKEEAENITKAIHAGARKAVASTGLYAEAASGKGNFTTVSGGYKTGMTETSWWLGNHVGQGSFIVMPEVGMNDIVQEPKEDKSLRKTNVLTFGQDWGEDSPALTLFADFAFAFGPFGPWTEVELANLARNNVSSVMVLHDSFLPSWKKGDYVAHWALDKCVGVSSDDANKPNASQPCILMFEQLYQKYGEPHIGSVIPHQKCFYQIGGQDFPVFTSTGDAGREAKRVLEQQQSLPLSSQADLKGKHSEVEKPTNLRGTVQKNR